ncbi:excisionase family DNA-binding protein [Nocardia salmonicida]|uniref:excisionase family DNA-binding protein n=1 Tax=Nocardia salmonicida TaxID=53431 RepID=UPI003CF920D8
MREDPLGHLASWLSEGVVPDGWIQAKRVRMAQRSGANSPRPSYYLSIQEAADRACVSKDTIRRMIASGQLKAFRFRGQIRIAIEDFDIAMRPIR